MPPLVDVVTLNPGQSAEEIERYITIPIEIQMTGIPYVTAVRSISLFGLSDVKVQFAYAFACNEAQQWVINLDPVVAATQRRGAADLAVEPDRRNLSLPGRRTVGLQRDRPQNHPELDPRTPVQALPRVIDVTGWGGKTRIYEITVNLDRMLAQGITLPQVLQTLNNSHINVGGQTVNFGAQAAIVRGLGLIYSMDQIRDTMITAVNGVPMRIGDIAKVTAGHQPRLVIAGQDDNDDIVQGVVLMNRGEQSIPTIRAVEAQVKKINSSTILRPASASSGSTTAVN